MLSEALHQLMPESGLKMNHPFCILVGARWATFDEITGHRKWGSSESQQWHTGRKFASKYFHGLNDIREIAVRFKWTQAQKILR